MKPLTTLYSASRMATPDLDTIDLVYMANVTGGIMVADASGGGAIKTVTVMGPDGILRTQSRFIDTK